MDLESLRQAVADLATADYLSLVRYRLRCRGGEPDGTADGLLLAMTAFLARHYADCEQAGFVGLIPGLGALSIPAILPDPQPLPRPPLPPA